MTANSNTRMLQGGTLLAVAVLLGWPSLLAVLSIKLATRVLLVALTWLNGRKPAEAAPAAWQPPARPAPRMERRIQATSPTQRFAL